VFLKAVAIQACLVNATQRYVSYQPAGAPEHFLNIAVALSCIQKSAYLFMAFQVWLSPPVPPILPGFLDALSLAATPVFVVLPGNGSQHIQQHSIYSVEN
jgi:hypothetical protein